MVFRAEYGESVHLIGVAHHQRVGNALGGFRAERRTGGCRASRAALVVLEGICKVVDVELGEVRLEIVAGLFYSLELCAELIIELIYCGLVLAASLLP